MELIKVEKIDDTLLKEIVRNILNVVSPIKIILFGSYAYGRPDKDSDIDILVIVDNLAGTRRELRLKIRKALRNFLIPKDIFVLTTGDVKEWENVPQSFISKIVREGKVIYER